MARTTNNPSLALTIANDVTLKARANLVTEFDMRTVTGSVLTDLSGNGNNATFTATPTISAQGMVFNGTYYGDFLLPSDVGAAPPFTATAVFTGSNGGYYVLGNRNESDGIGYSIRATTPLATISNGIVFNDTNVAGAFTTSFVGIIGKVYPGNQARGKPMGGGLLNYTNTLKDDEQPGRRRWRLGGIARTTGSDHDVVYLPWDSGTLAYFMLHNGVTTEDQDGAILEYIAAKLKPRGINL